MYYLICGMVHTKELVANLRVILSHRPCVSSFANGARCSSVVRAFAHGRRIDPSWGEPTELFLVPASVTKAVGWCI